jgi:hypothetical protein
MIDHGSVILIQLGKHLLIFFSIFLFLVSLCCLSFQFILLLFISPPLNQVLYFYDFDFCFISSMAANFLPCFFPSFFYFLSLL